MKNILTFHVIFLLRTPPWRWSQQGTKTCRRLCWLQYNKRMYLYMHCLVISHWKSSVHGHESFKVCKEKSCQDVMLCHWANTVSHRRRPESSGMLLWEFQISHDTNIITPPRLHFQFPFIDTQEDIYSSCKLMREQKLDHGLSFWW